MHQQKQNTQASNSAASGQDYFERLCQETPEVQKTASGLHYRVLDAADSSGQYPGPQDNVLIEYQGELTDGTIFDATRPGSPIWLPMNGVIAGFQEGLQLAQKGQTLLLYIPPTLGYGSMAIGKIPAHSTLVFKIKLIDIRPNLKQP
jgi:FKBP-type peptidyl-prolyl cis-trans isomerase